MEFFSLSEVESSVMHLQEKASQLIQSSSKRPLIALDLDYTLWPSNCFEHTHPPYKRIGDSPNPNNLKSYGDDGSIVKDKIVCIDRRTNHERSLSLYPEIRSILEWCADNRVALTICSKSPDFTIVKQILQAFGIWEWFMFPQIFNSRKTYHFRNLTEATGFKMNDFLFFDDDLANINMCTKIGISSCLVDKQKGLTWSNFVDGLTLFYNNQKASSSMATWLSSERLLKDSMYDSQSREKEREALVISVVP